jgi:hypothetical protein
VIISSARPGLAMGAEMLFCLRKLSGANRLSLALLLLWITLTNWMLIIVAYRESGLVLPPADRISEHIATVLVCLGVPIGAFGAAISAAQLRRFRDLKRELAVPSPQTRLTDEYVSLHRNAMCAASLLFANLAPSVLIIVLIAVAIALQL